MALSQGAFLMLLLGISCRQRAGADSAWSYTGDSDLFHLLLRSDVICIPTPETWTVGRFHGIAEFSGEFSITSEVRAGSMGGSSLGLTADRKSWQELLVGPQGEDHWASSYPYCGDVQQSPIDFHSGIFTYSPALEPIQLMGYNLSATQKLSLTNDGHAVKVSLPPTMHIISMSHRYTAVQLHLHWGSETDPVGSEHTISGRHYPSEMHIVHYNSEKYENASVAQDKVDGLAVLGILIQIGPFNAAYNHIFQHLKEIQHKGYTRKIPMTSLISGRDSGEFLVYTCTQRYHSTAVHSFIPTDSSISRISPDIHEEILIPGFNINDLLPRQLYEYFRYNGSLTTPPCYPSVQWTVFREPVQISSEQLLELESDLYFSNTTEKNQMGMVNNYRHVQELGEREVLISFPEAVNAGHTLTPGGVLIIALCCVLCIVSAFSLTVFFLKKRARKTTETRGVIYTAASAEDGPSEA